VQGSKKLSGQAGLGGGYVGYGSFVLPVIALRFLTSGWFFRAMQVFAIGKAYGVCVSNRVGLAR